MFKLFKTKDMMKDFMVSNGMITPEVFDKFSLERLRKIEGNMIKSLEEDGTLEQFKMMLAASNGNESNIAIGLNREYIVKALNAEKRAGGGRKTIFHLPIEKDDVLRMSFKEIKKIHEVFMEFKDSLYQRLTISISGYDNDPRELYEIEEVKKYIKKMIKKYPTLLYFLNFEITHDFMFSCLAENVTDFKKEKYRNKSVVELGNEFMENPEEFIFVARLEFDESFMEYIKDSMYKFGVDTGYFDNVNNVIKNIDSKMNIGGI